MALRVVRKLLKRFLPFVLWSYYHGALWEWVEAGGTRGRETNFKAIELI